MNTDGGPGGAGTDVDAAAEFADTLAHAGEADAGTCVRTAAGNETFATVFDFHAHGGIRGREMHPRTLASGMTVDVGEAFLQDAEERHLDGLGKAREFVRKVEVDLDATALTETGDVQGIAEARPISSRSGG